MSIHSEWNTCTNIICGIRTNRYNMFVMGNIQIVRGGIVYKIWCRYLAWLIHSQV